LSEEKKYKNYTIADIENYHKGLLSPKEMHELERAALDDPFLADVMEGYAAIPVNVSKDLSDLEKRLAKRVNTAKLISITTQKNSFKWWRVAAAVFIIGGIGFITFKISTGKKNKEVAARTENKSSVGIMPSNDSTKLTKPGTTVADSSSKTSKMIIAASGKKISRKSVLRSADSNNTAAAFLNPVTAASDFKVQEYDSINIQTDSLVTENNNNEVTPKSKQAARANNKSPEGLIGFGKQNAQENQQKINYFLGRVVDSNDNPLPFANITSTRYSIGTYADAQGNFTLISGDSILDVQVHSIGFENNLTRLKNNIAGNKVILRDDKAVADKIISYQKPDTARSRNGSMKFEEPEPADGWINYDTYLANNVNIPGDIRSVMDKRQVELSFEINQTGNPVNIKVEKSLCQKCDEEAIRLIKQGPKWKKKNKKMKRVTVIVPFDSDK